MAVAYSIFSLISEIGLYKHSLIVPEIRIHFAILRLLRGILAALVYSVRSLLY